MTHSPVGSLYDDSRFELKFVFDNNLSELINVWAMHCLIPDVQFPTGVVSSVYFDTARMQSYMEKRSSDFVKSKIRLRWYTDSAGAGQGPVTRCFVEQKNKLGARSDKSRIPVDVDSSLLARPLANAQALIDIVAAAHPDQPPARHRVRPTIVISYDRKRYWDPDSQSRVSVDSAIRCSADEGVDWVRAERLTLDTAVLEVKGQDRKLPRQLHAISSHLTREAFSKYARCCEHLSQPVARRT